MPGNARLVAAGQVFERHQAQPSGTRIPTGLSKSPSTKGGRIASSGSRLAIRSRLYLNEGRGRTGSQGTPC